MDFSQHPLSSNVNNAKLTSVSNVSNVTPIKEHKHKAYPYNITDVQRTATKLVDTFNDPDSFEFYCKVAWNLPESMIWNKVELAKVKSRGKPAAYFTFLCKLEMTDD